MAQLAALALAAALSFLTAGLDPDFSGPGASLIACLLIAAAMASKRSREAMASLWRVNTPGLAAFFILCAILLIEAASASDAGWAARRAVLQLTLYALAGVAAGAIAGVRGRSQTLSALIMGGVVAGLIVTAFGGRHEGPFGVLPPSLETPALGIGFGVLALLSCFLAADELRRRPSAGGRSLAPLSRRLLAPAAGLFTSFAMLFLSGAAYTLGALSVGLLAFAGAWALRSRRSPNGRAVTPAIAVASAVAAAVAVLTAGASGSLPWLGENDAVSAARGAAISQALAMWRMHPLLGQGVGTLGFSSQTPGGARLLVETGLLGAAAFVVLCAAVLSFMGLAKDRGRRMTRGFTLMSGVIVFAFAMALVCPGFSSPGTLLMLALVAGLATSYLDEQQISDAIGPQAAGNNAASA